MEEQLPFVFQANTIFTSFNWYWKEN